MKAPAFDRELDVRGLVCPMPIVKARGEVSHLTPGQVLRVCATDRGSLKDFEGWASVARTIELVGQETLDEDGKTVYVHYIRRLA